MHPDSTCDPIHDLMRQGIGQGVFPGAVLLVGRAGQPVLFEAYGSANRFARQPMTRETVFDLASLTKPLATTLAVAVLVDRGRIGLNQPVGRWLPGLSGSDKAALTVRQLLAHRSGLPAHRPFYMTLKKLPPSQRRPALVDLLRQVPLAHPPGERTVYSDLGFMLLGRLVEAAAGCPLNRFLAGDIYDPVGLRDLFFVALADGAPAPRPFAATELCPLRGRLLIGEVHDDNAWYAGGVEGHAGLFGSAGAVFQLLRRLVADYQGHSPRPLFSRPILKELFHGTSTHPFALGFDRPAMHGSSAGKHFSANTVGHLGFTGVSFWLDLDRDCTVILLTNRVHPCRWPNRLTAYRPRIHDRIMEHFDF
jgi:CubicO group peptidase (beta-lactamase class C family)